MIMSQKPSGAGRRERMEIKWCSLCNTWYIKCPRCGNNSCNGGYGENGKCLVCKDVYKLQDSISIVTGELLEKLVLIEEALRGGEEKDE